MGSMLQAREEDDEVYDEEQDDGAFQDEHPARVLVLLEELVEVVQSFEFAVDGAVPIAEMEAGGDVFVNAGEVPVTEELGDVREFIVEAGEVNADVAQFAQDVA